MWNATRTTTLLLTLLPALAGCDSAAPSTPSPRRRRRRRPPRWWCLAISGFSTSDLRDAQNQVVQFNCNRELIWTADGTRLSVPVSITHQG